jgi:two-component system, OmpR family, copper resistance phosphate regulon response regulator CusR
MRILIVEDEFSLAQQVKLLLEEKGYSVDCEYDGQSGLEAALAEDYDLVLLDVNLPTMSGFEVLAQMREEENATPVLMLTARDETESKVKGLNLGADDYVVKPFAAEELLARIMAVFRRGQSGGGQVLTAHDIELDLASQQVRRSGKLITLSGKEYALLEYMLRNKNQIIPAQKLLEHVWGGEVDPFSKVVDVYIGYLRKKIDKAFTKAKPLLITIKGRGYMLQDGGGT